MVLNCRYGKAVSIPDNSTFAPDSSTLSCEDCYKSEYQKCPVCEGRGIVPWNFYSVSEEQKTTAVNLIPETCRTCGGRGIIPRP
ncbi:MAG: hypothetical protein ACTSPI_00900 [Candidatus Heimdallarchaeaceae archaeon]